MIEPDSQALIFAGGLAVERATEFKASLSVNESAPASQSRASRIRLLVGGCTLSRCPCPGNRHGCIRDVKGAALAISNQPPVFSRRIVARYLNKQEGDVPLAPLLPPIGDEGGRSFA